MPTRKKGRSVVLVASNDGWYEVPISEMTADWQDAVGKLKKLLEALIAADIKSLPLNTIEIGCTITGEGGLAFVTKAGASASVKLIYKKP